MKIRYRIYPYPVLAKFTDDYIDSSFESDIKVDKEGYNIRISFDSKVENDGIKKMIKAGECAYCYHVECPQTRFRAAYVTIDNTFKISLKDSTINGEVQICPFIVAMQDIDMYENILFSNTYKGFTFNIEKGCKLSVGTMTTAFIEKDREDFANVPSIFSIIKNIEGKYLEVDINKDKIIISLPEEEFNNYKNLRYNYAMNPIIYSMIITPSLVYLIEKLKDCDQDYYEYENLRWFRALRKILLKFNVNIDDGGLENRESVELAQMLIDGPLCKAFNVLTYNGEELE